MNEVVIKLLLIEAFTKEVHFRHIRTKNHALVNRNYEGESQNYDIKANKEIKSINHDNIYIIYKSTKSKYDIKSRYYDKKS